MLPFIKPKTKTASLSIKYRKPDEKEPFADGGEADGDSGMHAAAQDILRAIESHDFKHLALALKAAFDIFDSQPHVEGEHLNESEE